MPKPSMYIYIYICSYVYNRIQPNVGTYIWVFPKIGVPQNGWAIMKNPIEMDDLGVHGGTIIFGNTYIRH